MNRTKHILVLTLVATALCADRVTAAAPNARVTVIPVADPIARLAANLGSRLSGSFRRQTVTVRFEQITPQAAPATLKSPAPPLPALAIPQQPTSPFQFRLPPPAL